MDDTDTLSHSVDAWLVHRDLAQAEMLLNRLFETAAASFNDPRILQYMVYVLRALQRYDECEMAMRTYVQLSLHAYKIAGVVYQHLQTTVHYAITIFANAHRKGRAKPGLAPEFAEAVQPIQKNAHLLKRAMFALCCEGIRSWGAFVDLLEPSFDLVLASIASGGNQRAFSVIKELLLQPSNEGFLPLGNLLCAEEEYERAVTAFKQVTAIDTFQKKEQVIYAQLAILEVAALVNGTDEALLQAKNIFSLFAHLFGARDAMTSEPIVVEPLTRRFSISVQDLPIFDHLQAKKSGQCVLACRSSQQYPAVCYLDAICHGGLGSRTVLKIILRITQRYIIGVDSAKPTTVSATAARAPTKKSEGRYQTLVRQFGSSPLALFSWSSIH